jgi:cystathionine beta-lyase
MQNLVTVTVTAASKGWNIAGLKCAIIVSQNEAINSRLATMPMAVHYRASLLRFCNSDCLC